MSLNGKKVLVGVSGGIAAYKACELVRRLQDFGADVRVMMTQSAIEFVTAMTFQALSGQEVYTDLFACEQDNAMGHIDLARWPDYIVIAPASANTLAKIAHGQADDLLTTVIVASSAKVIVCPAMNQQMWQNQATQDNIVAIANRGVTLWGPASGSQACGEVGPGRMLEASEIGMRLKTLAQNQNLLTGKRVLITAGPTREAIDPVRYISNHSSGKMGYALAQTALDYGADVILVSGPCHIPVPVGVQLIAVESAQEMYQAVMANLDKLDMVIAAAAVSDYRVKQASNTKIKKKESNLSLELIQNPDIVAEVAKQKKVALVVAFAAETCEVIANARSKLEKKTVDMVVANHVGGDTGFNSEDNQVTVVTGNETINLDRAHKSEISRQLIKLMAKRLNEKTG